jgi:uncharacterized protein
VNGGAREDEEREWQKNSDGCLSEVAVENSALHLMAKLGVADHAG